MLVVCLLLSVAVADFTILHASPGAPAVDVLANNSVKLASNVSFGQALTLPSGQQTQTPTSHPIEIRVAGMRKNLISVNVEIDNDNDRILAAVNPPKYLNLETFVLDKPDMSEASSKATIVVAHLAPDVGPVDVFSGGKKVYSFVQYLRATKFVYLPAGKYDFAVRPAGTTAVALNIAGVEVKAGMQYGVFVVGLGSDGTVSAVLHPMKKFEKQENTGLVGILKSLVNILNKITGSNDGKQ